MALVSVLTMWAVYFAELSYCIIKVYVIVQRWSMVK